MTQQQQIMDAINIVQNGSSSRTSKNKAFEFLKNKFKTSLDSKVNYFLKYTPNELDRQEIMKFVESIFLEIIMSVDLKTFKTFRQILFYVLKTLNRIDAKAIKNLLGEDTSYSDTKNRNDFKVFEDSLESNEPLPDKLLENNEIKQILLEEINKFPAKQKRVVLEYYHPNDPHAEDFTVKELAEKLQKEDPKYSERMIRHYIDVANHKIRENKKLKSLMTASNDKILNNVLKEAKWISKNKIYAALA